MSHALSNCIKKIQITRAHLGYFTSEYNPKSDSPIFLNECQKYWRARIFSAHSRVNSTLECFRFSLIRWHSVVHWPTCRRYIIHSYTCVRACISLLRIIILWSTHFMRCRITFITSHVWLLSWTYRICSSSHFDGTYTYFMFQLLYSSRVAMNIAGRFQMIHWNIRANMPQKCK